MSAAVSLRESSLPSETKGGMESDDDGPFFDLEFTLPEEHFWEKTYELKHGDGDKELDFTKCSQENGRMRSLLSSDNTVALKPKPQLHIVHPKPSRSFRIFTLAPRKLKSSAPDSDTLLKQSNFFVKFKAGEVPIGCFAGENSNVVVASEEKKSSNSKEVANKYFSKIKPLYVRVSKRCAEKLRLFPDEKEPEKTEDPAVKTGKKSQKPAMPARLLLACKMLGKSLSASSIAATASSPTQRHDESLLQQQDGIQSAIAHCKRSFNTVSKDTGSSSLQRSKSDPGAGSEFL